MTTQNRFGFMILKKITKRMHSDRSACEMRSDQTARRSFASEKANPTRSTGGIFRIGFLSLPEYDRPAPSDNGALPKAEIGDGNGWWCGSVTRLPLGDQLFPGSCSVHAAALCGMPFAEIILYISTVLWFPLRSLYWRFRSRV